MIIEILGTVQYFLNEVPFDALCPTKYEMRFHEIINESAFPNPGKSNSEFIIDLREPSNEIDERKRPRPTMIVFTSDEKVILYYWADGNSMTWTELYSYVDKNIDKTIQQDMHEFFFANGIFGLNRNNAGNWNGDRNKTSPIVTEYARRLQKFDLGLPNSKIGTGNWASGEINPIGTIKLLSQQSEAPPKRIVVYHGTSSARFGIIEREGLKPLDLEDRVWNKGGIEKVRPAHRDYCVYLTASKGQAEYYAKKATIVDTKRFGPAAKRKAFDIVANCKSAITKNTRQIEYISTASYESLVSAYKRVGNEYLEPTDQRIEAYRKTQIEIHNKDIIEREAAIAKYASLAAMYTDAHEKIVPIVFQVTLGQADMKKLMADDDFLRNNPDAFPQDWLRSLKEFSQIAYAGTIPPNRIKKLP